jgi:hydroxypyruvate isomerase
MNTSVCIDAVFSGWSPIDAIQAVKTAGFDAYEFWGWWDKDLAEIRKANEKLGMHTVAFCTRFISLVDSVCHQKYIEGLKESIQAAQVMGCGMLITQVGNELQDVPRSQQHGNIVKGLKACVPLLEASGLTLAMEPLNTMVDHKGYYLDSSDEAFEIIEEVGSPCVRVLFDIYHQHITEGNRISSITMNINKICHFHAAGYPGRHELSNGEICYADIFRAIGQTGYQGFIGLEYFPIKDTNISLDESKHILKPVFACNEPSHPVASE